MNERLERFRQAQEDRQINLEQAQSRLGRAQITVPHGWEFLPDCTCDYCVGLQGPLRQTQNLYQADYSSAEPRLFGLSARGVVTSSVPYSTDLSSIARGVYRVEPSQIALEAMQMAYNAIYSTGNPWKVIVDKPKTHEQIILDILCSI